MTERSRFAGGDQRYLRDEQYAGPGRLAARTDLHVRYGTAPVPWFPWVQAQLALPDRVEVLEVGCGTGWLWATDPDCLPDGLRLTLTDLSQGMLTAAVERVRGAGVEVADHVVASVDALPFAADSFDVVVANHMLYHSADPARAVAGLSRLVRPGGRLIAATNGARHLRELGEIRAAVFGAPPLDDTVTAFGIDSGRPMLEAVFDAVEWRDYPDELHVTEPADLMAFLMSVPPGEGCSPEEERRLTVEVGRRFAEGDGTMVVSKESGLFVAGQPRAAVRA